MAILQPVTLVFSLLGDGTTAELDTYLAPLFIATGLPGTTVPQRIVSINVSDGSAVTAALEGQTLKSTFATAPADAVTLRITVTLGV